MKTIRITYSPPWSNGPWVIRPYKATQEITKYDLLENFRIPNCIATSLDAEDVAPDFAEEVWNALRKHIHGWFMAKATDQNSICLPFPLKGEVEKLTFYKLLTRANAIRVEEVVL